MNGPINIKEGFSKVIKDGKVSVRDISSVLLRKFCIPFITVRRVGLGVFEEDSETHRCQTEVRWRDWR